jgi:hypothetical protein
MVKVIRGMDETECKAFGGEMRRGLCIIREANNVINFDDISKFKEEFDAKEIKVLEDIWASQHRLNDIAEKHKISRQDLEDIRTRAWRLDKGTILKKIGKNQYEAKNGDYDFVIDKGEGTYTINVFNTKIKDKDKAHIRWDTVNNLDEAEAYIKNYG